MKHLTYAMWDSAEIQGPSSYELEVGSKVVVEVVRRTVLSCWQKDLGKGDPLWLFPTCGCFLWRRRWGLPCATNRPVSGMHLFGMHLSGFSLHYWWTWTRGAVSYVWQRPKQWHCVRLWNSPNAAWLARVLQSNRRCPYGWNSCRERSWFLDKLFLIPLSKKFMFSW